MQTHLRGRDLITLDDWTKEEIVAALQTGKRPDGRELAPIMPWRDLAIEALRCHVVRRPDRALDLVDGRVLSGQPDELTDLVRVAYDVVPGDGRPAGVGSQQGGEDAYGRGLARSVGPQNPQDAAGAPTPIQPGSAELTIDVSVVYLIG